jgi:hypothetical protein
MKTICIQLEQLQVIIFEKAYLKIKKPFKNIVFSFYNIAIRYGSTKNNVINISNVLKTVD